MMRINNYTTMLNLYPASPPQLPVGKLTTDVITDGQKVEVIRESVDSLCYTVA